MMINPILIVNLHHNLKNHHSHNRPHNNRLKHPLNLAHNRPLHLNHLNNLIHQLSLNLLLHPPLHILTKNKKSTRKKSQNS